MTNISSDTSKELDRAGDLYSQIEKDLQEFAQGATDFQIEVFIANGEGPIDRFPVHAYRHLLAQVRPLISEMRRVLIDKERTTRKIDRMKEERPQDWDLDILELEYKLKDIDIDLKGKWSTYQTYEKLLGHIREKYGPFTHKDLQKQEAKYWAYRLSKQMFDSKQGAISGLGSGNLNSLRMAFQGSILPDSPHKVESFEPNDNQLTQHITETSTQLSEG
ncbi:MAG: hypothetical protein U9Q91_00230 [Candidatus Marinimicrobia bacterium]|nr:hypothetical protein [Candidatus Neomarinimicrobiota bacterium]